MIKFFLHEVLQELNISQTKFAKHANIRPNTINDLCNNRTKRIEVETLNRIMETIYILSKSSYSINDIIRHFPDSSVENKIRGNSIGY